MFRCLNCNGKLTRTKVANFKFWRCEKCDGRSITISALRKRIPRNVVNDLWQSAKKAKQKGSRHCPSCNNRMKKVPAQGVDQSVYLDVCTRCQFVWLDPKEFESLPKLSPQAIEAATRRKRNSIANDPLEAEYGNETAGQWWHWLPGLLGMPVEHSSSKMKSLPWVTWSLALMVTIISLLLFTNLHPAIERFGLIPAQWDRDGGLTLITSFFIHGGILHLVGNMYFFLIFGDNVEDFMGKGRYILLIFLATIFGHFTHILFEPRSMIPCIGASGGISGVIAFYALKYPRAKIGFVLFIGYTFRWMQFPALGMFFMWFGLQLYGAWQQIAGFGNVSSLAHLGGAFVGLVFWLFMRNE